MINLKNKKALKKVVDEIYEKAIKEFDEYCKNINDIPNDTEKMFIYYRLLDEYFEGVIIEDIDISNSGYYMFYICKNGVVVATIEHDVGNDYSNNPGAFYIFKRILSAMDFTPFSLQKYIELLPKSILLN